MSRRNVFRFRPFMLLRASLAEIRLKAPRTEQQERDLVEAAQKDPSRFADLYEDNFERVYAFVARRVSNREIAEDLTSEVFHHALANLSKFEWRGVPFTAWLCRIASNAIADRWRREAREQGNVAEEEPAANAASAEDLEYQAALFRMVRRLPAEQRRVIEMRFAEEKSIREIAQALRLTEGAVKQLQFRGLEKLRAQTGAMPGERNG
jgi:RNA polymerase sigma-70 factor (ECF subfamily)